MARLRRNIPQRGVIGERPSSIETEREPLTKVNAFLCSWLRAQLDSAATAGSRHTLSSRQSRARPRS